MAITSEEKTTLTNTYVGLNIEDPGTHHGVVVPDSVVCTYKDNTNPCDATFDAVDTWCKWIDAN